MKGLFQCPLPLVGNRNPQGREDVTALSAAFSKITPTLSPSGKREETAPPRRSEPLRSKVGGPSKVSPWLCEMDRLGIAVYSLQLIVIVYD